jgi:hypothetical protein
MTTEINTEMIVKKTNVWGQFHNVRKVDKRIRLMKKRELLNCYPFIDHYTIYTYKPKHQKGQSKEEQSFILSYAYNYDAFADENVFIQKLNEIGLFFHKEKCMYCNKNAYKIIIHENKCSIDILLQQLESVNNEVI